MLKNKDEILFLNYPRCTTCIKARKWLESNNINFTSRHIVEDNPNEKELKEIISTSSYPLKRFFNTSGVLYREMNLKDKLQSMSDEEMIKLLATNGKLVKRPIIYSCNGVLVGFKEEEWKEFFKK